MPSRAATPDSREARLTASPCTFWRDADGCPATTSPTVTAQPMRSGSPPPPLPVGAPQSQRRRARARELVGGEGEADGALDGGRLAVEVPPGEDRVADLV